MRGEKKFFLFLVCLLFGCSTSIGGAKATPGKKPIDIYGTWKIYRYVEHGGHMPATEKLVKKSIGQKIEFGKDYLNCLGDSFIANKGLYKGAKYRWKIRKYNFKNGYIYDDGYDKGTLAFFGVDDSFEDKTVMVMVDIGKGGKQYLEVTKKGELATYGDGYFVFLKKVK